MVRVRFLPFDLSAEFESGTTLLDAARSLEIPLRSDCGGVGKCGKCRVLILHEESLDFSTAKPVLACRRKISEPCTVFVPPESLADDAVSIVVDSLADVDAAVQNPVLTFHCVSLDEPGRNDCRPDMQRLYDFLAIPPTASMKFVQDFSKIIRKYSWRGNVVFLEDSLVDFVAENDTEKFYAVALDVGTTTLAAELIELNPDTKDILQREKIRGVKINPQKRFGHDIISRIQKALDDPENLFKQQRAILDAVNEMLRGLALRTHIDLGQIIFVTVSGNTVMQQLFHGIDPRPLGATPFVPATRHYPVVPAHELGLPIHPRAVVRTFPILGGFVGGDLVAGILATKMDRLTPDAPPVMLIDIGTNGEMILAARGRIWAAATAAGPAFEGAGIEHGMIASTGAVDRVDFSDGISIHVLGDTVPRGICGSGLIDLTAELLQYGIINSRGRFVNDTTTIREDIRARIEEIQGQPAFRLSEQETGVYFTQRDVRQIQLAAGAVRSGIRLLLEKAELAPSDVQEVFLAGGFGSFIRRENARRIGLFPPEITAERIRFCGNTSLLGASMLAQDRDIATRAQHLADRAEHVDLSMCENFMNVFAESMIFP